MNKGFNHTKKYKELDSHIKCFYASNGKRKTILINRETTFFYEVVTRVNYLTTILWIEHVNKTAKEKQRFCWLTEQKNYRRDFETRHESN